MERISRKKKKYSINLDFSPFIFDLLKFFFPLIVEGPLDTGPKASLRYTFDRSTLLPLEYRNLYRIICAEEKEEKRKQKEKQNQVENQNTEKQNN